MQQIFVVITTTQLFETVSLEFLKTTLTSLLENQATTFPQKLNTDQSSSISY